MGLKQTVQLTGTLTPWYPDTGDQSVSIFSLGSCIISPSQSNDRVWQLGIGEEVVLNLDGTMPLYLAGVGSAILTPYDARVPDQVTWPGLTDQRLLAVLGAGAFTGLNFTADRHGYLAVYYQPQTGTVNQSAVFVLHNLTTGEYRFIPIALLDDAYGAGYPLSFFLQVWPGTYQLTLTAVNGLSYNPPNMLSLTALFTTVRPDPMVPGPQVYNPSTSRLYVHTNQMARLKLWAYDGGYGTTRFTYTEYVYIYNQPPLRPVYSRSFFAQSYTIVDREPVGDLAVLAASAGPVYMGGVAR